jgi:hypothetical protein
MQLTRGRPLAPRRIQRPSFFIAVMALVAVVSAVGTARSDSSDDDQTSTERQEKSESNKKKADVKPEDTATKRAGTEVAGYLDSDHVAVLTPSIHGSIENVSGASLNASYLVDIVSAASADIVSTASNRWQEVRQAGGVGAQYKPHDFGVGVGGSVSSEPDYLSYGFFATVVKDFDEKNWTLNFGYGYSHDTAGRCGDNGQCTPFSVFSRDLQRGSFNGGISWVVDRASLASVTADLIIENGDQSKVYRYIPMFSPTVAGTVPLGASVDWVNANRLPERPLEQLPLERHRFALTGRYAHRFDGSTVRLEERFYDDDWGLIASSSDARWIFDLGKRFALWPHARLHVQNSVSFWERAYISGPGLAGGDAWNLPLYRTGDRELGPLWTVEGGGGIKWYLGSDADPRSVQLGFSADWMTTSYTDDLYLTSRTGYLGALTLEVEW